MNHINNVCTLGNGASGASLDEIATADDSSPGRITHIVIIYAARTQKHIGNK